MNAGGGTDGEDGLERSLNGRDADVGGVVMSGEREAINVVGDAVVSSSAPCSFVKGRVQVRKVFKSIQTGRATVEQGIRGAVGACGRMTWQSGLRGGVARSRRADKMIAGGRW